MSWFCPLVLDGAANLVLRRRLTYRGGAAGARGGRAADHHLLPQPRRGARRRRSHRPADRVLCGPPGPALLRHARLCEQMIYAACGFFISSSIQFAPLYTCACLHARHRYNLMLGKAAGSHRTDAPLSKVVNMTAASPDAPLACAGGVPAIGKTQLGCATRPLLPCPQQPLLVDRACLAARLACACP